MNNCERAAGVGDGKCWTEPRYSVSTDIGQTDDHRTCARHLQMVVAELSANGPVVVARLIRGAA